MALYSSPLLLVVVVVVVEQYLLLDILVRMMVSCTSLFLRQGISLANPAWIFPVWWSHSVFINASGMLNVEFK